jgi:lipoyl(octanoyl) transferase
MELAIEWLGRRAYRDAWHRQHEIVAARDAGSVPDTLLLVEHEAVLTLGRRSDESHVRASAEELARRGVEVIRVERGGEVTYHGPGQLVAYPIVRLRDRGVLLRPFVRALEASMADVAAAYGVSSSGRPGYPGLWVEADGPRPRKLGALGLRLERGITYHGIALNITAVLADFELIDPCGMADLDVTSIARELGWTGLRASPTTESVAEAAARFGVAFERRLDEAEGASSAPPDDRSARSADRVAPDVDPAPAGDAALAGDAAPAPDDAAPAPDADPAPAHAPFAADDATRAGEPSPAATAAA